MVGAEEIENRFGYHKGTEETMPKHQQVRNGFKELANELVLILPEGREKSLAMTKLQEAAMWANCSVAMQAPLVQE